MLSEVRKEFLPKDHLEGRFLGLQAVEDFPPHAVLILLQESVGVQGAGNASLEIASQRRQAKAALLLFAEHPNTGERA
jgi:hypothetical protein